MIWLFLTLKSVAVVSSIVSTVVNNWKITVYTSKGIPQLEQDSGMMNVELNILSAQWIGLPQSRHWIFLILFDWAVRGLLGKIKFAGLSLLHAMKNGAKCCELIKWIVMVYFRWQEWKGRSKNVVKLEKQKKHTQLERKKVSERVIKEGIKINRGRIERGRGDKYYERERVKLQLR